MIDEEDGPSRSTGDATNKRSFAFTTSASKRVKFYEDTGRRVSLVANVEGKSANPAGS